MSSVVRHHPLQLGGVGFRHDDGAAHFALPAGRLARQDMALERASPQELASPGLLEALGGATVALQLGHDLLRTFINGPCAHGRIYSVSRSGSRATRLAPGRGARIVWSWLPSFCGSDSVTA